MKSPLIRKIEIAMLGVVLFLVLAIGAFLFSSPRSVVEAFRIPGNSMHPTLQNGDYVLVNKLAFGLFPERAAESRYQWATPARGDVVVFTPEDDPATEQDESRVNFVKRVVGLPGEQIQIQEGVVYINGKMSRRYEDSGEEIPEVFNFPLSQIPNGRVFLLGDNFRNSLDSRFWSNPFVPVERIKGKVFAIYFSSEDSSRAGMRVR